MVVDEVRHQQRATGCFWIAYRFVPIEHGRTTGIGLNIGVQVRKIPLADYEVRNAISIDVGEGRSISRTRKRQAGNYVSSMIPGSIKVPANLNTVPSLFAQGCSWRTAKFLDRVGRYCEGLERWACESSTVLSGFCRYGSQCAVASACRGA